MVSDAVSTLFFHLVHAGTLPEADDVRSVTMQREAGPALVMQCQKKPGKTRACFQCNGDPIMLAACEWLCCALEARSPSEQAALSFDVLAESLQVPTTHQASLRLPWQAFCSHRQHQCPA